MGDDFAMLMKNKGAGKGDGQPAAKGGRIQVALDRLRIHSKRLDQHASKPETRFQACENRSPHTIPADNKGRLGVSVRFAAAVGSQYCRRCSLSFARLCGS